MWECRSLLVSTVTISANMTLVPLGHGKDHSKPSSSSASETTAECRSRHFGARTRTPTPGFSTLSEFLTIIGKIQTMAEDLPECPATPSLRQDLDTFSGWMTPESARPSHITKTVHGEMSPSTPHKSLLSPKSRTHLAKHSLDHVSVDTRPQAVFLPTPLTVGTGRKTKQSFGLAEPSTRSKSLTATLQALAYGDEQPTQRPHLSNTNYISEESEAFAEFTPFKNPSPANQAAPTTPPQYNEPLLSSFSDSEDEVQIVKISDLHKIPRKKLRNPFTDDFTSPQDSPPEKHSLDLSTHMEMVNHRTGERRVEKLSAEQQRFKPRKLNFTLDVKTPVRVNYNVTNKYIGSSIGKSFIMGEPQAKSSPGFNIFDDSDDAA